ncbi:MAG: acyl-CoA/acyl-ACP dehydrogenase [Desulfobacterales bacterium]|nr:acyl-CoA/acyl-ACP dehydrogenase [Desulfobacterales bacterium]
MNGGLSREQNGFRERVRSFVENEISHARADALDRGDAFPHDILEKMAQQGLTAVNVPVHYGGEGGGDLEVMILCEELSRRSPALSWVLGNVILYGNNIIGVNGSEAQRNLFLPSLAKGRLLFAFGLTEPDAGSDAANINTTAQCQDSGPWIVTGGKTFITGGTVADYVVTFARTAPPRYKGITAFLVDTRDSGFSFSKIEKLGFRGSDTATLYFDQVPVPEEMILGGPEGLNRGWSQMVRLLNGERLSLAACSLGIGQAAFDAALDHVRQLPPPAVAGSRQATEHLLAEMAAQLEAARALAYRTAWMHTNKMECVRETSMSKLFCSETAKKIAVDAMAIMGPDGCDMALAAQRRLRDVLILSIGGGTSQIQKNIVAKTLGL